MTDELDRIRDLRPSVSPPSGQLVESERNRLMTIIDGATQQGPRVPAHRRKRWLGPGAAIALLAATAAAGYSVSRDVGTTTEVSCPDAIIDAVTGDPLVDAPTSGASRTVRSPRPWSHMTTK